MSWADRAAPLVAEVIRRVGRNDLSTLRKTLADAYPWGEKVGDSLKGLVERDTPPTGGIG